MEKLKQGKLIPTLGLFSAFFLTVSSVIGSGVYKKVAPMSAELGSPVLVMICWIAAGLITLCGALSNAEVAGMLADAGGEYVYFKKIYNRFFAFLFGWANFTAIRSASIASIAYVFAQSFNSIVQFPKLPGTIASISIFGIFFPFDNFGVKVFAIVLIVALSYINYVGLNIGERLSRVVLFVVIGSIFLIILLGLTVGGGELSNIQTNASTYTDYSWTSSDFIKHLFVAMLAAFWAYEGWAPIGYLGGEIKNPNRNLPLALIFGVLFVMLVYVAINFTYLYILPIDTIIEAHKSQNAIAAVLTVNHFSGKIGTVLMSLVILLTTFGATNTTILTAPRLYYAMAKENLFFKKVDYIHPKYNTPSNAFVYQAIWASTLVLSGTFDQLTDMLVFASFIFYGATTLGVFILRHKMPDAYRPYKTWGYPALPAFFILFCFILIVITIVNKPREAFMGLSLILTGVPLYFLWNKKRREL